MDPPAPRRDRNTDDIDPIRRRKTSKMTQMNKRRSRDKIDNIWQISEKVLPICYGKIEIIDFDL
ncbi:unnamed protein product [Arabidopsis halleri]